MTRKALIIYENTGSGHRRVAKALEDALASKEGVLVSSHAGGDFFDAGFVNVINGLWNYLIGRNWIRLADVAINFLLRILVVPVAEALSTRRSLQKLDEFSPDLIICTADGYSRVLGTYSREKNIPFYLVITDVSVFLDLVSPVATHICYFPETVDAVRSFSLESTYFAATLDKDSGIWARIRYVLRMYLEHAVLGYWNPIYRNVDVAAPELNRARCVPVGPIVESAHYEERDRAAMRDKHGIPADVPCVVVVSGGIGGAFVDRTVRALQRRFEGRLTVVAVCGRDAGAYRRTCARRDANPSIKVTPLEFVDYMAGLHAAADAVVTRPSAGCVLEALVRRTPVVIPGNAASNDAGCVEVVRKHGLGGVFARGSELPRVLAGVLEARGQYRDRIDAFLSPYPTSFAGLQQRLLDIVLP